MSGLAVAHSAVFGWLQFELSECADGSCPGLSISKSYKRCPSTRATRNSSCWVALISILFIVSNSVIAYSRSDTQLKWLCKTSPRNLTLGRDLVVLSYYPWFYSLFTTSKKRFCLYWVSGTTALYKCCVSFHQPELRGSVNNVNSILYN